MAIRSLVLVLQAGATRHRSLGRSLLEVFRRVCDQQQLQQEPEGEGRRQVQIANLIARQQPDWFVIINRRSQIDIHEIWAKGLINLG